MNIRPDDNIIHNYYYRKPQCWSYHKVSTQYRTQPPTDPVSLPASRPPTYFSRIRSTGANVHPTWQFQITNSLLSPTPSLTSPGTYWLTAADGFRRRGEERRKCWLLYSILCGLRFAAVGSCMVVWFFVPGVVVLRPRCKHHGMFNGLAGLGMTGARGMGFKIAVK